MNYLLDKKTKQRKFLKISLSVIVLVFVFYFRIGIIDGFSYVSHKVFRPVFVLGSSTGKKFKSFGSYFISKKSLYFENENLKNQIIESQNDRANYATIFSENINLKEILGRKNEKMNTILGAVLSKPNQNIYDTFIIDIGTERGIKVGNRVFAKGNIPIGRIEVVYDNSSKVVLFSNPGERTQAVVADVFMEVVGRGGGNFEMILPRDFDLKKGDLVVIPGISPYVLAVVKSVMSDTRDSFMKALLVSPVNMGEVKFVEVEIQK